MKILPGRLLLFISAIINCKISSSASLTSDAFIVAADEIFVANIPKIELHAHLHGSIRPSTLQELSYRNSGRFLSSGSSVQLHCSRTEKFSIKHIYLNQYCSIDISSMYSFARYNPSLRW